MKIKTFFLCLFLALGIFFFEKYAYRSDVTVVGSVNLSDGLGRQTVELVDTLQKELTFDVIHTTHPGFCDIPKTLKKMLKKSPNRLGRVILFEDCVEVPGKKHYLHLKRKKNPDEIRLAYSMFESSKIPQKWVEVFNTYFDGVVVPDPYHISIYQQSGVTVPIFHLPLGINLSPFLQSPLKLQKNDPFVFGCLGTCIERKNLLTLIQAFEKAFQGNPNVLLKINSRYSDQKLALKIKQYINKHQLENVQFTELSLWKEDYIDLLKSLDCLVNISKGEGFSIQPREALAAGIPVIVTNNTAQKTICDTKLVIPVPAEIPVPALNSWGTLLKKPEIYGYQYDCNKEDVEKALLEAYENYEEYLSFNPLMREWARYYHLPNLKPYYRSLLKPKTVIFGENNQIQKEGLVTNSYDLFLKYQKVTGCVGYEKKNLRQ